MNVSVNQGEFGQVLRFNVGQDISSATVTFEFKTKDSTVTIPATVPTIDTVLSNGDTLYANEYAEYTIESARFADIGNVEVRLIAEWTSPARLLKTNRQTILVLP